MDREGWVEHIPDGSGLQRGTKFIVHERRQTALSTMSNQQRETAFLRHCISYHDSVEHQALDDKIGQIQRDERCVRGAAWLMVVFTALAIAGLGYSVVFVADFPPDKSHLTVKVFGTLGLASLISLLAFAGYWSIHRRRLNQHREECRWLATMFMESRLGQPGLTRLSDLRGRRMGEPDGRVAADADAFDGFRVKIEPTESK